MLFCLPAKKIAYVLTSEKSIFPNNDDEGNDDLLKNIEYWEEDDFLCKNYMLNGVSDDQYDYYNFEKSTAKDIWEELQNKYDTEETGPKHYAVSCYLKYQITDDKSVEVNRTSSRRSHMRLSLKV